MRKWWWRLLVEGSFNYLGNVLSTFGTIEGEDSQAFSEQHYGGLCWRQKGIFFRSINVKVGYGADTIFWTDSIKLYNLVVENCVRDGNSQLSIWPKLRRRKIRLLDLIRIQQHVLLTWRCGLLYERILYIFIYISSLLGGSASPIFMLLVGVVQSLRRLEVWGGSYKWINKLLTVENLTKRNWNLPLRCVPYVDYLFIGCRRVASCRHFWHLLRTFRRPKETCDLWHIWSLKEIKKVTGEGWAWCSEPAARAEHVMNSLNI